MIEDGCLSDRAYREGRFSFQEKGKMSCERE